MQIWFLSNGSYSLKNCHNPFGKAIQPPPLTAKFRLNTENPYVGLPLGRSLVWVDECSKVILIASISLHAEVKPAGEPPIHAMSSTPLHLGEPYKWIGENQDGTTCAPTP